MPGSHQTGSIGAFTVNILLMGVGDGSVSCQAAADAFDMDVRQGVPCLGNRDRRLDIDTLRDCVGEGVRHPAAPRGTSETIFLGSNDCGGGPLSSMTDSVFIPPECARGAAQPRSQRARGRARMSHHKCRSRCGSAGGRRRR